MRIKLVGMLLVVISSAAAATGDQCVAGAPGPKPNIAVTMDTRVGSTPPEFEAWLKRERHNFSLCLASWEGSKLNELIYVLGAPTRSGRLSDGNHYSVWEEAYGEFACTTTVFTRSGVIVNWQAKGNLCRRASGPASPQPQR